MRFHKSQTQVGRSRFDDPLLICTSLSLFIQKDSQDRICDVGEYLTWLQRDIWCSSSGHPFRKLRGSLAEFEWQRHWNIANGLEIALILSFLSWPYDKIKTYSTICFVKIRWYHAIWKIKLSILPAKSSNSPVLCQKSLWSGRWDGNQQVQITET
jgi:hypothetical protein